MRLGQEDEAQAAFARARALDPNDIFAYYFAGGPGWTRRLEASISLTRDGVTRSPTFGPAWWSLGSLYTAVAHYDEATSCFERCARLTGLPDVAQVAGVEAYWAECLRRARRLPEARAKCLEGLDAVERSDFLFRDSIRVFALVTLGRIANDQGDTAAARVAFQQAIEHVQGRPGTMAGGTLWVRAQACLARLDGAADRHRHAVERFGSRQGFDFSWLNLCDDYETCAILAESALAVGDAADAELFARRARSEAPPAYSGAR